MVAVDLIHLIVGLGNPGGEYEKSRHNVGFWLLDEWATKTRASFSKEERFQALLAKGSTGMYGLKPTTYMNLSGRSVAAFVKYYKLNPNQILVVHDDLDLPVGSVRLKQGGGHGGHNGLRSITQELGTDGYRRVRLGIGRPPEGWDVTNHVLGSVKKNERTEICKTIIKVIDCMEDIRSGEFKKVMNRLNTRDKKKVEDI
jgi:peptidyl-tRNA hydrolase, PTH1 family